MALTTARRKRVAEPASPREADLLQSSLAGRLLGWYDRHHRDLPWRIPPTAKATKPDPYRVWLSEIMLQQTTVEAVKPYFRAFTEKWPDVQSLAAAQAEEVMRGWAGLGYYSRARNLLACARQVAAMGAFPDSEEGLRALPGIGPYTAAAIAAIAFGRPACVVDGNVERVVTRHEAIETPLPAAKAAVRERAAAWVPEGRPGDFAQAMMDLGATICTPRRPACLACPIREDCAGLMAGDPERFPVRPAKAEKPLRKGAAFVAVGPEGAILVRRRPEKGLLGGLLEVPTTDWNARKDGETGAGGAPFAASWRKAGRISHVFTHFSLELEIFRADVGRKAPSGLFWCPAAEIAGEAFPTVMKKAIEAAIPGTTRRR